MIALNPVKGINWYHRQNVKVEKIQTGAVADAVLLRPSPVAGFRPEGESEIIQNYSRGEKNEEFV